MCQRVVIALALACKPQLLIADEPTTGLDVTTQKAVMDLIVELTQARGMSTILITHDLGLAAAYCDRVVVMEKGHVVETAAPPRSSPSPQHPYTRKLMRATPRPGMSLARSAAGGGRARRGRAPPPPTPRRPRAASRCSSSISWSRNIRARAPPALLGKLFAPQAAGGPDVFRAVDGISFAVGHGESVGLVGESGCGKSTTSMMVMRLLDQTSGRIVFDGEDIGAIPPNAFARLPLRSRIQMVFQDPTDSLNPRFTAARAIADPILRSATSGAATRCARAARSWRAMVGLPLDLLDRFPHQLSGGQKARVGIARAIALQPELVILDEPTAALDVSVQAVVLNLLQDLKAQLGMSYLFVSHDLNVVRLVVRSCHCHAGGPNRRGGPFREGPGRSAGRLHQGAADGDPASAVAGSLRDCLGA